MIQYKNILFIVYIICIVSISKPIQASTITHIKGKAYRINENGSFPISRQETIPKSADIVIDENSQIQIEWKQNNYLEVIGPARFQVNKSNLYIEFGRFLWVNPSSFPLELHIFNTKINPPSQSLFEIEISPRRLHAQILAWQGRLFIHNKELKSQYLYLLDQNSLQEGQYVPEFSQKRLRDYQFSSPYIKNLSESFAHKSYRNQLISTLNLHFIRINPASSSNFKQNTIGFGSRMEWIHKRYFNLALRPQRIHYLMAPAFRFGLGGTFLMSQIQSAGDTAVQNIQLLGPHIIAGVSWLGVSIDSLVLYTANQPKFIQTHAPVSYSLRSRYEWDLKEFTPNDLMISLGYELGLSQTLSSQYLPSTSVVRHGIELSLHFNF